MSEHIVHTAVVEDSFAVAEQLKAVSPGFREVMERYLGFARLGCITVSGDRFSFRLLEEYKSKWRDRDELLKAKLAFVLGWVSHRACDRQMKPIWNIAEMKGRGSDADPSLSPTECSVYHEGAIYNRYYAGDPVFRCALFREELRALYGAELFDFSLASQFAEESFAVNLMDIQTIPDDLPDQAFFEEMCMRSQKFYVDIARYAKSAGDPDPGRTREYLTGINWFDENDEIIAAARKLRSGEAPSPGECERAFAGKASSHYGKALQLSIRYFIAAADYFGDAAMPLDTLKERLDIGKKGRGGLAV